MPSVLGLAHSSRRRSLVLLIVLLVPLLGTGCGGGSTYSVNEGQIAQRFLPTERSVSHHPDSLRVLSITEEEEKVQYQLKRDYQALVEKWSSRFQNVGTGRSVQSRTYATFWSLELSLASLQPEMGIQSLQKEKARELIEKRRKEYFDTIQIDVYWFIERRGESGIISGPSARIELQVGDNTYRPLRSDRGPLREAYVSGGNTILYRRNILYFPRTVDGTDILQNAPSMQLEVHRIGTGSVEQFSWRWETEPSA
jgi:hypothetical protein